MRNRSRFIGLLGAMVFAATAGPSASTTPGLLPARLPLQKLDPALRNRASLHTGRSRVIVRGVDVSSIGSITTLVRLAGGTAGRSLPLISSRVADLPNSALAALAASPLVEHVAVDRLIVGAMERTGATVGATTVRQAFGYDGAGIGVAVIDSGVAFSHDDFNSDGGSPRVDRFVDFVNGQTTAYDDYGHGTHVAGIVAGNGFDSNGARSGIAPAARLIVLKVLDGSGRGRISDVIAALDYVVAHKDALNIRIVNLSVATGVYESYHVDPLTLAAERVVKSGVVVVAAAGNSGRDSQGRVRHGGVTAPGNAPWVLTVGASSHMGTIDRADDTIAQFSSRGPTAIDYGAKPDIVAPGVGIESLSDPSSALYSTRAAYLLPGAVSTTYLPYLSLSGTSMAAPVVSGTVALMLQANPSLTPNEVKAILQYTAQVYADYDPLTQGAGFLNAKGAVELARYLGSASSARYPDSTTWGARIIWGNRSFQGGRITQAANAWSTDVTWGAPSAAGGQSVAWGVLCSSANCKTVDGTWRWGDAQALNVVWGPLCDGADCLTTWSAEAVWGTSDEGDTVVWGTADEGDTVVWGTGDEGDTVVWGTSCSDPSCEPVIWKNP
jgi:serine protease AprX